jgi:two-component sensor histidine kinase
MNNEFASAIATVSLAAAASHRDEEKNALAVVEERLRNYVHVNRCLELPLQDTRIDASAHLQQLCQSISRSKLNCRGIELLFVDQPLQMNSKRCWRLAMIISELITNSARHAFGDSGGKIRVELSQCGAFVECSVADNGTVPEDIRPGRGLTIVEALVAGLGGTINQYFGPSGTVSDLRFPLYSAQEQTI